MHYFPHTVILGHSTQVNWWLPTLFKKNYISLFKSFPRNLCIQLGDDKNEAQGQGESGKGKGGGEKGEEHYRN